MCSVIDADNDITLSLLTRYFVHCTEEQDTTYLINILTLLTTPERDAALIEYRQAHPIPQTWLARMIRGASTLRKLFDKCGTHLTQTMKSELSAGLVQDFIVLLFELVNKQGKALSSEIRQSSSFWTNLFIYMRRNAERKISATDKAAERRARGSIRNCIGFTANWMHACHFDAPAQLRPFVELCVKADLFGALDPALPRVASMQGVNSTSAYAAAAETPPNRACLRPTQCSSRGYSSAWRPSPKRRPNSYGTSSPAPARGTRCSWPRLSTRSRSSRAGRASLT